MYEAGAVWVANQEQRRVDQTQVATRSGELNHPRRSDETCLELHSKPLGSDSKARRRLARKYRSRGECMCRPPGARSRCNLWDISCALNVRIDFGALHVGSEFRRQQTPERIRVVFDCRSGQNCSYSGTASGARHRRPSRSLDEGRDGASAEVNAQIVIGVEARVEAAICCACRRPKKLLDAIRIAIRDIQVVVLSAS